MLQHYLLTQLFEIWNDTVTKSIFHIVSYKVWCSHHSHSFLQRLKHGIYSWSYLILYIFQATVQITNRIWGSESSKRTKKEDYLGSIFCCFKIVQFVQNPLKISFMHKSQCIMKLQKFRNYRSQAFHRTPVKTLWLWMKSHYSFKLIYILLIIETTFIVERQL